MGLNLQVADAVVNLDVPWNPARLEQRIARVHRIGSKRTVNEILIATRDSVEHRILLLHETKKNVLANVWAKGGEDVIAAPGGSGLFRDVVRALCATQAPEELMPQAEPSERVAGERAAGDAAAGSTIAQVAMPTPAPTLVDAEALARAMAAVAPSLPAEHRGSLAVVFRALADALEG